MKLNELKLGLRDEQYIPPNYVYCGLYGCRPKPGYVVFIWPAIDMGTLMVEVKEDTGHPIPKQGRARAEYTEKFIYSDPLTLKSCIFDLVDRYSTGQVT